MNKFTFKDIVKVVGRVETQYYIVTNFEDFSPNYDGSDFYYDVVRIYPVATSILSEHFYEKDLMLVTSADKKEYKMIMEFVLKQEGLAGWKGKAHYLKSIEANSNLKDIENLDNLEPVETTVKDYTTIDQCLDAMNTLELLYVTTEDKSYLQLRELIADRLKELSKESVVNGESR